MKKMVLAMMIACALCLSGCGLLSGLTAASEAFNETQANVEKAQADLQTLTQEVAQAKADYDAALAGGDKTKIEAATLVFRNLVTKWEAARNAYESSKAAFDAAAKRLADAKGTDSYLWNILGIVTGSIAGLGAGFGKWGKVAANLASGVKKIADNNVDFIDPAKIAEFKATLRADMTPAEIAAVDKARAA